MSLQLRDIVKNKAYIIIENNLIFHGIIFSVIATQFCKSKGLNFFSKTI